MTLTIIRSEAPAWPFTLSTVWDRSQQTPLRQFVRTETGSAAVLLAAAIVALIWANVDLRRTRVLGHRAVRAGRPG